MFTAEVELSLVLFGKCCFEVAKHFRKMLAVWIFRTFLIWPACIIFRYSEVLLLVTLAGRIILFGRCGAALRMVDLNAVADKLGSRVRQSDGRKVPGIPKRSSELCKGIVQSCRHS